MKLIAIGVLSAVLLALGLSHAKPESPVKSTDSAVSGPRRPVLLELFTSEGCSSCPPADRLLETFDRTQPVAGTDLIVLSEHVDYWNRLGWTDPYSSPQLSERQQDYVDRLHLDGAYTPQLIVDGHADVIGSDEGAARAAVLKAARFRKATIDLKAQRSGSQVEIELRTSGGQETAAVYIALAKDHITSQVLRGENSGRTLNHVAVVTILQLAGKTDPQGVFTKKMVVPLTDPRGDWRVVAFTQNPVSKQILSAAQIRL